MVGGTNGTCARRLLQPGTMQEVLRRRFPFVTERACIVSGRGVELPVREILGLPRRMSLPAVLA
eukprot:1735291-Prorocentrum_lima.AAC.1